MISLLYERDKIRLIAPIVIVIVVIVIIHWILFEIMSGVFCY